MVEVSNNYKPYIPFLYTNISFRTFKKTCHIIVTGFFAMYLHEFAKKNPPVYNKKYIHLFV